MIDALAFWIASPGHGEIRAERLSPPQADEVLVRALYSGISRGTEALVFQGRVPESEYARMRAPFQAGDFPGPLKYGYACVGRIEQGPAPLGGRHAFVLYPHQTQFVVPAASVYLLPEDVAPARAVLAANLETAINGVWDARPHLGDRVTVIGAGTVGCLVAWLLRGVPGCDVQLVDVNPNREAVARRLDVPFARPDAATSGADVVIHTSGSPAGLELALRVAAFEATVVEMSWYGRQQVPLALGEGFHAQRLTVRSSQVGRVPVAQAARWTTRRRMELALRLLADPVLDALITGESEFAALPQVMAQLASAPGDALCHRIRYS
jgi:threonine dehydrogenase-like Zn-dependent dehydrogenase